MNSTYAQQSLSAADVATVKNMVSERLKGSILWMVVGLVTTMVIGFLTLTNSEWFRFAASNYHILLLVELGTVFLFSYRAYSANIMTLRGMFFFYSALNGVVLAVISYAYGIFDAVVPALLGTLAFFVSFAIVGAVTKRDLSGFYPYLFAVLIGMIIVSLGMMFLGYNDTISLVMGYLGVIVFSVFTAVDVNRIRNTVTEVALTADESILERIEITGALNLYLDFINLFLSLLRIFGNRR